MNRLTPIVLLFAAAGALAQQPPRPTDQEIDARFQVLTSRLAAEISRAAALEARLMMLEAELAKAKEDAKPPKPEEKK